MRQTPNKCQWVDTYLIRLEGLVLHSELPLCNPLDGQDLLLFREKTRIDRRIREAKPEYNGNCG